MILIIRKIFAAKRRRNGLTRKLGLTLKNNGLIKYSKHWVIANKNGYSS